MVAAGPRDLPWQPGQAPLPWSSLGREVFTPGLTYWAWDAPVFNSGRGSPGSGQARFCFRILPCRLFIFLKLRMDPCSTLILVPGAALRGGLSWPPDGHCPAAWVSKPRALLSCPPEEDKGGRSGEHPCRVRLFGPSPSLPPCAHVLSCSDTSLPCSAQEPPFSQGWWPPSEPSAAFPGPWSGATLGLNLGSVISCCL